MWIDNLYHSIFEKNNMNEENYCPFSFNGKCTVYPSEHNDGLCIGGEQCKYKSSANR